MEPPRIIHARFMHLAHMVKSGKKVPFVERAREKAQRRGAVVGILLQFASFGLPTREAFLALEQCGLAFGVDSDLPGGGPHCANIDLVRSIWCSTEAFQR